MPAWYVIAAAVLVVGLFMAIKILEAIL